jgi:hypothetical protein
VLLQPGGSRGGAILAAFSAIWLVRYLALGVLAATLAAALTVVGAPALSRHRHGARRPSSGPSSRATFHGSSVPAEPNQ